ncbi:40209_t:CDS:2 [Gigaspora margarita]|uniref:40209_t:CDS:1 n=1 Tax=Gigaspora margarita TaxID=4874 RepID=A0ABN7V5F5_GIGMA|nr:40209_t:CDS:2 [Gigaspora margarita]
MKKGEEISNYPKEPNIKWKEDKRSFYYNIIKEGTYSQKSILYKMLSPASYPISHDYIVQTTWGRGKNKCTIQCSINYIDYKPVYQVVFGINFCEQVISYKSPSNAALLYHQQTKPEIKTQTSNVLLFANKASNSTLSKRARNIGKTMLNDFTNISKQYYNHMDDPILEELQFSVNNHKYKIEYDDESLITKKQKCEAIVKTVDQEQIAQHAYRSLANIKNELPRQDENNDPEIDSDDENSNVSDPKITSKVISSIGKGTQRSIKDILKFIVPDLVKKEILNS